MSKRHKEPSFRLPKKLMYDAALSLSAQQVAVAIFRLLRDDGTVRISQRQLAAQTGLCVDTVNRALHELEAAGYLGINQGRAYRDWALGHAVRSASIYFCSVPTEDYILVPYRLIRRARCRRVCGAALLVLLYLHCMMGQRGRCWPSLSRICKDTALVCSTVCVALNMLEAIGLILRQHCRKRNGAFSSNSYFPLLELPLVAALDRHSEIQNNTKKLR